MSLLRVHGSSSIGCLGYTCRVVKSKLSASSHVAAFSLTVGRREERPEGNSDELPLQHVGFDPPAYIEVIAASHTSWGRNNDLTRDDKVGSDCYTVPTNRLYQGRNNVRLVQSRQASRRSGPTMASICATVLPS